MAKSVIHFSASQSEPGDFVFSRVLLFFIFLGVCFIKSHLIKIIIIHTLFCIKNQIESPSGIASNNIIIMNINDDSPLIYEKKYVNAK
jgi:hypothetical protein